MYTSLGFPACCRKSDPFLPQVPKTILACWLLQCLLLIVLVSDKWSFLSKAHPVMKIGSELCILSTKLFGSMCFLSVHWCPWSLFGAPQPYVQTNRQETVPQFHQSLDYSCSLSLLLEQQEVKTSLEETVVWSSFSRGLHGQMAKQEFHEHYLCFTSDNPWLLDSAIFLLFFPTCLTCTSSINWIQWRSGFHCIRGCLSCDFVILAVAFHHHF